jgi:hypothetical protein
MLDKELETFRKVKAGLSEKYPSGGYVVINGEEILGVWSSRMDALQAGLEKYGDVSFLVKNISADEVVVNFSRNLIFH